MTVIGKIEPEQRAAPAQDNTPVLDSGLRALAAVARHYQLDWSLARLSHIYDKGREPDARELVRIARAEGRASPGCRNRRPSWCGWIPAAGSWC
jgi:hypothetical protein